MRAKATIIVEFELAEPDEYDEEVTTWQEAAKWDIENCITLDTEMNSTSTWSVELLDDPALEPFKRTEDEEEYQ